MRTLVFGSDQMVADWVAARIPHVDEFKDCKTIGVMRDGELIAGVVYHEFRGNDIQISCAGSGNNWLSRSFLETFFRYPFTQLGCDRVTSFTPKNAATTRRFLLGLGFVEEGNFRRGFRDDDCIVYGMLRDECKWIKE